MTNTVQNTRKARYLFAVALVLYALTYTACRAIDIDHCRAHGLEYGGTSLGLDGFCMVSGVRVPAEAIGRP